MKTQSPIEYKFNSYLKKAIIPAGTTVVPASNLPSEGGKRYWSKGWRGMTKAERSHQRNYGFLLTHAEVKA
jgi:hypothetical protein